MSYHQLINWIREHADADDDASQDALEVVVENVAAHLTDSTRRGFAAQLPDELQNAAMMVPTANYIDEDIVEQIMDLEDVDESQARKYIRAAWQAIRDMFDSDEVREITDELPLNVRTALQ